MRIGFAVLLGAVIALGGISIILNSVFHIDVPIFRTALGLLIIYAGANMAVSGWRRPDLRRPETSENHFAPKYGNGSTLKYDVVFTRGTVDLSELDVGTREQQVEVNVVFGDAVVKLPADLPYEIEASSVFGAARMPDRDNAAFGSLRFAPQDQTERARLRVKLNVVFGAAEVVEAAEAHPGEPRASLDEAVAH